MNSDVFAVLRTDFPSGHPFQLPPAGNTVSTTTLTQYNLANGAVAIVSVPSQTAILGSATPLNPNANAALSADVLGMDGDSRGLVGRPYFISTAFDLGRPHRLRAIGTVVVGATQTAHVLGINVYQGTTSGGNAIYPVSTNATSSAGVGTSAAGVTAGSYNFIIEATMLWDSSSQKLVTAEVWSTVCGTYSSRGAAGAATSTGSITPYTALQYNLAFVWGVSNAANNVTVTEFSLERV